MNALTPVPTGPLVLISDRELLECLARTPLDQFLIWNGRPRAGRPNSVLSQALAFVDEIWTPVPLRILLQRTARLAGLHGLSPEAVKKGLWSHQAATPTSYFLVRERTRGEYVAVTDVPRPSSWFEPLCAGDVVLNAAGRLDQAVQRVRPRTQTTVL